jgi:hypothetical protein
MAPLHSRVEVSPFAQEDRWFSCLLATLAQDRQRVRRQFRELFGVGDPESALVWALAFEESLVC